METRIDGDSSNFTRSINRDQESSMGEKKEDDNEEESYFNLKRP